MSRGLEIKLEGMLYVPYVYDLDSSGQNNKFPIIKDIDFMMFALKISEMSYKE